MKRRRTLVALVSLCVLLALMSMAPVCLAAPFLRGNSNGDAKVDISDMVHILNFLFLGGQAPACGDAADVNDDGVINISDPSFGLNFLFLGGFPPPPPGAAAPGFDGTPTDSMTCGDAPEEPSPLEEISDLEQETGGFEADPTGKFGIAALPGDGIAAVIDLATGKRLSEIKTGMNPGAVRIGPRGTSVLINNLGSLASPGTDVTWADLTNPARPVSRMIKFGARAMDICWANDSLALLLGAGTAEKPMGMLGLVDGLKGELMGSINLGFRPRGVDVDAAGALAAIVGEMPDPQRGGAELAGGIALIDLAGGKVLRSVSLPQAPLPIEVRMAGGAFFVSDGTQTGFAVVKLNEDLKILGAVGRGRRGELLIHPDGKKGYCLTQPGNELLVFDTATMKEITTFHLGEPASDPVDLPDRPTHRMVFAEKGALLLIASGHGGHLAGVDTAKNQLLGEVSIDPRRLGNPVSEIRLSGDGRSLYLANGGVLGSVLISEIRFSEILLPPWRRIVVPIDRIGINGDTCFSDVAVLMDDGNANANTSFVDGANQEIMSNVIPRFYASFPDVYDFVVVFYSSEFPNITSPGAFAWSLTVRNFTRNINRGIGNGINGSGTIVTNAGTSRLQCMIWENDLNEYDGTKQCINQATTVFGNLRDGLAILGQEVLHRWSSRLDVAGKGCTILRDNAHYHAFFNSDASVVGGSQGFRIQDNGGNNFVRTAVEAIISDYDEYLMGFLNPNQVAQTMFCVQNPVLNADSINFTGTRRNISMNDITTANGARIPTADISQHTFNMAFALVVPNGDHVLTADLAEVRSFRDDFEEFFNEQTGGRGHLNTRICPLPFSRVLTTIPIGDRANRVAASPNGRWVYAVSTAGGTVTIIGADPTLADFHDIIDTVAVGPAPGGIAFRADSARAFVTIRDSDRVDIINTATRAVVGNIAVGNEPVGIYINKANFGFVTNRADNDVTVIRPLVPDAIGDLPAGTTPQGVAGTLDSELVVFTNRGSNTVTVHGTRTAVQRSVATGSNPIAVDVVQYESLPNQTAARINNLGAPVALAYVANAGSNSVTVIDITTNPADPADFTAAALTTIDVGRNPVGVAFQPNGAIALVCNRDDDTVTIIEVASHTVITTVAVGDSPEAVAFSPDGKRAYVANAGGNSVTVLE